MPRQKANRREKKVAATAAIMQQLLAPIPDDLRGMRDRALLLVGFAGALRRSELAAIRFERLEKTDRGLRLTMPQTKGRRRTPSSSPCPTAETELCPVRALNAWLAAAGITDGPVFRRIWLPARGAEAAASGNRGEMPANRGPAGQSAEAPPPLPRIGKAAITSRPIADIVQARAVAAGFAPARSRRPQPQARRADHGHGSRHPSRQTQAPRAPQSFDVLGEYLEFGDLFDGHPLTGVL